MSKHFPNLTQGWAEPSEAVGGSVVGNQKLLADWIGQLPLANPEVSQRLLHKLLSEIGTMRMEPAQRAAALEALRAPVAIVSGAVERQILGLSFPLPPGKARVAALARDTDWLLAHGWRQVVVDWCGAAGKLPFLRGKAVAQALERAMMHMGAVLEQGYLVYAEPPQRAWQTLHALLGFARDLGLAEKAVPDPLLDRLESSPQVRYAQACLLALGNPFRLNQREIADAARLAQVWSHQVRFGSGAAALVVDPSVDEGPGYLPEERRAVGADTLSLDLGPLIAELDRRLAGNADPQRLLTFNLSRVIETKASAALVAKLRHYWQQSGERAANRLPAGYDLESVIGFKSLHTIVGANLNFAELVLGAHADGGSAGADLESWTAADAQRVDLVRAEVLDQSARGYRLRWSAGDAPGLKVGEVIGLGFVADPPQHRDWMVGLVRWMRIANDGQVDAGIELLARRTRAASLRALDGPIRTRAPTRALWLDAPTEAIAAESAYGAVVSSSSVDGQSEQFELTRTPVELSAQSALERLEFNVLARRDLAAGFTLISLGEHWR